MIAHALAAALAAAEPDASAQADVLAPLRSLLGESPPQAAPEHAPQPAPAGELASPPATGSAPEAALAGEAGSRGELRFTASSRSTFSGVTVALAGSTSSGERAPQRTSAQLQIETARFRTLLDVTPGSAGLWRVAGELEARGSHGAAAVLARSSVLGDSALRGVGARVETEGAAADWAQLGASATAWALWLSSRSSFAEVGAATLDWSELAELSGWTTLELFGIAWTPSFSASLPAQGGLELRSGLNLELKLGGVRVQAGASAARLLPMDTWLFAGTAGVAVLLR